jgi:putative membrane protein
MNRALYLIPATLLALAGCKQNTAETNNMAAVDLNATGNTEMPANAMATNTAAAAGTATPAQTAFLTDAMKGDNGEVALGTLAQQKGASEGVKDLGTMLATDHGAHKATLATLAGQTGVATTDDLKTEAKTEETKLNGLSGAAFDKEFVRATVEDHKKDIAAYEKEAKGTGPVATMAQQTLPTLKKHLETAEKLQK